MVKDGSTIILGGLREEQKTASSKQLPFLGNIPFLGFMFRDRSNKTERTELLVLLTPTIITGDTLVTSDKRALGTEPGKGYEEYPAFTTQTELKEPQAPPEEKIKPYLEYSVFKEAKESKPTIKGEEQYEIK